MVRYMKNLTLHQVQTAILGAVFLLFVSLLLVESFIFFVSFISKGTFEFSFASLEGSIVAGMFVTICCARTLTLWVYDRWASQGDIPQVRYHIRLETLLAGVLVFLTVFFVKYLIIHVLSRESYYSQLFITWKRFDEWYGYSWGIANTILQYVYYAVEGLLMVFIIDVFQTIGDLTLPSYTIPWGGICLALFWGLPHYFSKGLFAMFWGGAVGLLTGLLYVKDHKILWIPLMFWMSILVA